jgi:hypothetical protein
MVGNRAVSVTPDKKASAMSASLGSKTFREIEELYRDIFVPKSKYSLVIFVARRAFALFNAFREWIESERGECDTPLDDIITSDDMLSAWIAESGKELKDKGDICVVDDTMLYGAHLRALVKRLTTEYGIAVSNITVKVLYACQHTDEDTELLALKDKKAYGEETAGTNSYSEAGKMPKEQVQRASWDIVKAIHASGTPYVSYIPAFTISFDEADGRSGQALFASVPPVAKGEEITRDCLAPELREWGFENITVRPLYDVGVEAFCLFPPRSAALRGISLRKDIEYGDIEEIAALRVYVNYGLGEIMIVPHITFRACSSKTDITSALPKEVAALCGSDTKRHETAHRLLRYVSGYIYGRNLLNALEIEPHSHLTAFAGLYGGKESSLIAYINGGDLSGLGAAWKFLEDNATGEASDRRLDRAQNALVKKLQGNFAKYKGYREAFGLVPYVTHCFFQLNESIDMVKSDTRFEGLSLGELRRQIESALGETFSDEQYVALTFKLCDWGGGVTKVVERGGVVEPIMYTGELCCCVPAMCNSGIAHIGSDIASFGSVARRAFIYYANKYSGAIGKTGIIKQYYGCGKSASNPVTPPSKPDELHPLDDDSWYYAGLGKWCKLFNTSGPAKLGNAAAKFSAFIKKELENGAVPDDVTDYVLSN